MQKYAHLNRDVKNGTIHIQFKKKWVSHIQFPWKKGAYRIPGSAEKRGLFGSHIRTMSYIGSYPSPPPPRYQPRSRDYLSLVVRKPVFGVSDQVPHKPGSTTTQDCERLEISYLESRGVVLSMQRKQKALISFAVTAKLITAKLSCVFVCAYAKCRFSHDVPVFLIHDVNTPMLYK